MGGKVKVTINADDAFCSRAVAKPTKKPASIAPEQFHCGNSAKYSNIVFLLGGEKQQCGTLVNTIKDIWTVFRREKGNPEFELFFDTCCAPTTSGATTAAKAKASTTKKLATTSGAITTVKASTTK